MISLIVLAIMASVIAVGYLILHSPKEIETTTEEEKRIIHRRRPPVFTSISSCPEDEREKRVDKLLKKKKLCLEEQQFIYDYLIDTGKEKWRYIKGYEGYYMINTYGLVWSCRNEIYLSPGSSGDVYQVVLRVDGKGKTACVHRLVAETFIPNPNSRTLVQPKDGNYHNCNVSNLMWKAPKVKMMAA